MKSSSDEIAQLFVREQADMFLTKKLLWADTAILLPGVFFSVMFIVNKLPLAYLICPFILFVAGLFLPLCIKNQMLIMMPGDRFAYRTMFGNVYKYHFDDVQSISFHTDSKKLLMPDGRKIHIERCAYKSQRFSQRLDRLEEGFRNKARLEIEKWQKH